MLILLCHLPVSLYVVPVWLLRQVGRGRREEPNHCDMFAMVMAGTLGYVVVWRWLHSHQVLPWLSQWCHTGKLPLWVFWCGWCHFPEVHTMILQFTHPVHSEAAPFHPSSTPRGPCQETSLLEVHLAGSFPHNSNQVHPFHCCLWKWMLVPIQLLSSFLHHLRSIATVFRLLKF